jgi:ankyrin repeat protein
MDFLERALEVMDETDHRNDPEKGDEDPVPSKTRLKQVSLKNLCNYRDHLGRTPLHVAAMHQNKAAVETLLYIKSNPHIEDELGLRPISYVDPASAIAELLRGWQNRIQPVEVLDPNASESERRKAKAVKKDAGPQIALGATELRSLSEEALLHRRLNETQDNYLQACVKAKLLDSVLLLRTAVNFPIGFQNAIGNTVLHNAIATDDPRYVKAIITEKLTEEHVQPHAADQLADIKGNYRQGLQKCLLLRNAKGSTALQTAIETSSKMFMMIWEVYVTM